MSSKRKLRKQVLSLLECKPRIHQPGRLITHIRLEIGYSSKTRGATFNHNDTCLVAVLEELAKSGLITLKKAGNVYVGVELKQ